MNKKYKDLPLRSDPNYMREWVRRNKEKRKTYVKTYTDKMSPERKEQIKANKKAYSILYYSKKENVITRYLNLWKIKGILNLDWDIYTKTLNKQNNNCKICHKKMTKPQADHCHTTGNFRAILCSGCNLALGTYEKMKNQFENYLKEHNG